MPFNLRAVLDEKIWGGEGVRAFEGKALYFCGGGGVGVGWFSIQWVVVFCENVILWVIVFLKNAVLWVSFIQIRLFGLLRFKHNEE